MPRRLIPLLIIGMVSFIVLYRYFPWKKENELLNKPLCKGCNVVIIDIDILRADALPCYGYARNTAPNICQLAQNGVLFSHNISQFFSTLESMTSTITGTYQSTHGIYTLRQTFPSGLLTMAEIFKSAGYQTVYNGGPNIHTVSVLKGGGTRGFDSVIDSESSRNELDKRWEESIRDAQKQQTPFFLYLYSSYLHWPYLIESQRSPINRDQKPAGFPETQKEFDRVLTDFLVLHYRDYFTDEAIQTHPDIFNDVRQNRDEMYKLFNTLQYPKDWPFERSRWMALYWSYTDYLRRGDKGVIDYAKLLYDTKIHDIDAVVGKVVTLLERSHFLDKTIIVILSEHGEEFKDHGDVAHQHGNYNELIHTPLIIATPRAVRKRIDTVSQNIDLLPTLLEMTGLPIPSQIEGTSLLSYMTGGKSDIDRYGISEFNEDRRGASIQNNRWKLIASDTDTSTPTFELYNLVKDPHELKNIVDQENTTVGVLWEILKKRLEQSRNKNLQALPPAHFNKIEEATKKHMKKE